MRRRYFSFCFAILSGSLAGGCLPFAVSAQILETETARIPHKGHFETGFGYEFQRSAAGTEHALPFSIEMGLTDRLALLVEPVPYTSIRPKGSARSTGFGDIEVTATYVAVLETHSRPALALAAEAKIPTARNVNIGTTKPDFAGYVIFTKETGNFISHANVGYTIVGQPVGVRLKNVINGALATEFLVTRASRLFAEVLATTASTSESEVGSKPGSAITPEASGGELVGTLGIAHLVTRSVLLSFGLSYDNSKAVLYRPGVTFEF